MTATASPLRIDRSLRADPTVLIVVPPFQGIRCPALGASQLKGNLLQAGHRAEILYLNLKFAERIGPRVHEWLSGTGPYLLGEYVFSHAVHDFGDADVRRYVDEVLAGQPIEAALRGWYPGKSTLECVTHLIAEAKQFIRGEAIDLVLARDPWMVGLSSTFQSNCCALAVIRELKKRRPDIATVIGGANCEGVMGQELLARYPEIDYVGRGECDKTFVQLVGALRRGEPGRGLLGFLSRHDQEPTCPSPPLHGPDLDQNAYPDFVDYFGQLEASPIRGAVRPGLAMETSRGCWWGMKQHCTFCAFNREGMVFRSKAPERALEEISSLVAKYGVSRMEMTDNILDMAYFKNLLKDLAGKPKADLFWETKSNLSRDQVRLMRKAGINWIQPGIESLSDLSLKLMRKGATQLQQVQALKYCTESGVRITWNWLFGFPGEDEQEMPALQRSVRAVHHLQPPSSSPVLYLERFSPYFETPEQWGLAPIRPAKAYHHVYPLPPEAVERLAFFFDSPYLDNKGQGSAHSQLEAMVEEWNRSYPRSHFLAVPRRKRLLLIDTRPHAKRLIHRLSGLPRKVYEFCWKIRGERDIVRAFEAEASEDAIRGILRTFVDDMVLLEGNGRYLALATDPRHGYKAFPAVFPGGGLAQVARRPTLGQRLRGAVALVASPGRLAARVKSAALDKMVSMSRSMAQVDGEIGGESSAELAEVGAGAAQQGVC